MDCRPGLFCKWLKTRNHKNTLNSLVHNKTEQPNQNVVQNPLNIALLNVL